MELFIIILNYIWKAVLAILNVLLVILEVIFGTRQARQQAHKAAFGNASSVLSYFNKGFCMSGNAAITLKQCFSNALLLGSSGTGKTSAVILPTLLRAKATCSYVITDPSGELLQKSGGWLKQQGFNIRVLNFSSPDQSEGYNPLSQIHSEQDIQKIASMLVKNALQSKKGGDPFWELQATSLLGMIFSILRELAPKEHFNLYNVRHILNLLGGGDPEVVDSLFVKTESEALYAEYLSFVKCKDNVTSSVIATAKSATQIFTNPAVARVTSVDTFDFSELRSAPTALFISTNVADQRYFSILTAILFEQLYSFLMRKLPAKGELPILMIVDEAPTVLGFVPTLPIAIANLRKYQVGGLYAIQTMSQMRTYFGNDESETIKSNCNVKMYLGGGGQTMETYTEISKALGETEYEREQGGPVTRPLMSVEELRTMPASQGLLFYGSTPGIKLRLKPYYKNYVLRKRSELPAPVLRSKIPAGQVPLLQIQKLQSVA